MKQFFGSLILQISSPLVFPQVRAVFKYLECLTVSLQVLHGELFQVVLFYVSQGDVFSKKTEALQSDVVFRVACSIVLNFPSIDAGFLTAFCF